MRLIAPPVDDLFSTKGRMWLEQVQLDERGREALDSELRLLARMEEEIDTVHLELARNDYDEPRIRLLVTLPGIDVAVAQTLLAALGDIERFSDADHAASYNPATVSIITFDPGQGNRDEPGQTVSRR